MFHNAYVVFDALDESVECEEVLTLITRMKSWNFPSFHILVTSRQLSHIEEIMSDLATTKICLQDSRMSEDIALYISDKLKNDKTLAKWPPDIRLQITTKLLTEEDGM